MVCAVFAYGVCCVQRGQMEPARNVVTNPVQVSPGGSGPPGPRASAPGVAAPAALLGISELVTDLRPYGAVVAL
jgi:hypothetical protein